ncbi:sensor histidine kinase [Amphibacillus jilinensis]|uniref:sensor histidine kinase n=1 Tax=Amphibacillus jilinensis TaxID=1216008 RepID=UPI0002EE64FE|nr:sensor histidine kinase [Amphibacillus jilinensis]
MKLFKKYSYKNILFFSLSVFLFSVLMIIIYVNYHVSVNEIINLTATQQQTNLDLISQNIDEKLRSIENNSVVLARQSSLNQVINGNRTYHQVYTLTTDFSNSVYSNGSLHSIEIYLNDAPTNNIQNPVRYYELDQVNGLDWIDSLDNLSASWIGIQTVAMITGEEPVISHARAIKNSRGQTQAIVILNLDPLIVESWLRSYSNASTLYLVNEHSHVLASTDHQGIGENYHPTVPLHTTSDPFLVEQEQLIVSTELVPYQWNLIGVTPYQQLTAPSKKVAQHLLIMSTLLIILTFFGIRFLTRHLTQPIHQLTDLMNNYQLTRTMQNIPNDYQNEFAQLFNGYQNLIKRNERLHHSLIKKYRQHKRAELKALQANINPHFLYNTLDQLNWRAIERGDDDMSLMIELLGDMLRTGLSNGESILTLEEEINYVKKYLQLQSIKYNHAFQYTIDLDEHIKDVCIPKLTLQPFVENAIIHGFQETIDGKISINIFQRNNQVFISIRDNGVGATSFSKSKQKVKTGGYGIKNVRERLNNYFNYKATIMISNREQGGVEVQLTFPVIRDKKALSFI